MMSLALHPPVNMALHTITPLRSPQQQPFTATFDTTSAPPTDPATVMQRADEVNALHRMLCEPTTSVVTITGYPGAGKATLAALLCQRLQLAAQSAMSAPKHVVWLRIGAYTTLHDVLAAIQSHILAQHDPGFFLQTAEQQIATIIQTLNRPQESALVILDGFERFLHPETNAGLPERGAIALFLEQLRTNLSGSRVLLICNRSPYSLQEQRVRSYLVSRINIPEGVALLQQRGVQGSYEDLSLIWQRCAGHTYSLVLFSTLAKLSRFPPGYFLHSPQSHSLWHGEVTAHLVAAVYRSLNPMQQMLIQTLSIFDEPVPFEAIQAIITAEQHTCDTAAYQRELAMLLQVSLVRQTAKVHGSQNIAGYWLHPLLQQHALSHYHSRVEQRQREHLSTSLGVAGPVTSVLVDAETDQAALTTAHRFAAQYYQGAREKQTIVQEKWRGIQDIEPILSTIRHLCRGGQWQEACDLLFREGLSERMISWGAWDTLTALYMQMLPPTGVLTRRDEAQIYNQLGLIYERLGNHQRSYTCYEEALALQRKIGDTSGEAISLSNQGELLRILGARDKARANFEQALQLNTAQEDPQVAIAVQHNLALLYHAEKNYPQALRCYQHALQQAEKTQAEQRKGTILTNIGVLLFEQGLQAEALAILLYVLQARERISHTTLAFIHSFVETLKNYHGVQEFTRLCHAALAMQEKLIARLMAVAM